VRPRLEAGDVSSLVEAARVLERAMSPEEDANDMTVRLAADLAAYLYFVATVVAYFNDALDERRLSEAEHAGDLDKLAECRQAFVMGAAEAWHRIDNCRIALRLDPIPVHKLEAGVARGARS
jgi:hypothetical protein